MQRLALRPFLRALRLQQRPLLHPTPASRLASSTAGREPPVDKPSVPSRERISAKAALDPAGVYTPGEFVDLQLQSPQVQRVINGLSQENKEVYDSIRGRLTQENGHSDIIALNDIGEFLDQHGVDLDLPGQLFEPTSSDVYHHFNTMPEQAEVTYIDKETNQARTVMRGLMDPIPHIDDRDTLIFPPSKRNTYGTRITARNHNSVFDGPVFASIPDSNATDEPTYALPMNMVKDLYQSILIARTVKQQTGKGKIMRKYFGVCVGNGNGLVGYGEAKDPNARLALQKARIQAVKNMDYVERFEERTLWSDMESKLGATRLVLRPRPVGFGLRCNPFLHQILRAAGLKDVSAKVLGSRNKLNVIKAAFNLIHAGHAPPGMGDGIGGKGTKLSRGIGMQGKMELERARGRKLISLRK